MRTYQLARLSICAPNSANLVRQDKSPGKFFREDFTAPLQAFDRINYRNGDTEPKMPLARFLHDRCD